MTNKLPNSLEEEIRKFLCGYRIDPIILTEDGLEQAANHFQKQKEEDETLFRIKHFLQMAITLNEY
tara:strand:- start:265 stop:462 length:198 start_codon:yes stop_codon:yes gene_type:complete